MNATRQSPRTYALTIVTHERRRLFQVTANAQLMTDLILRYRAEQKILLHAFVIMPDHLHVLLTPTESIERTAQLLSGVAEQLFGTTATGKYARVSTATGHRNNCQRDFSGQLVASLLLNCFSKLVQLGRDKHPKGHTREDQRGDDQAGYSN